jgi:hypothetical protein
MQQEGGGLWEGLPAELLLKVLDALEWTRRSSGAVRGTCRAWRTTHDAGCTFLSLRTGVTDRLFRALCARLPMLAELWTFQTLTDDGLCVVGRHSALTSLNLGGCSKVTDVGLRQLRGLTALTTLSLCFCPSVTDAGLQHLTCLSALLSLDLYGASTTQAGRDALKAALPALTIGYC